MVKKRNGRAMSMPAGVGVGVGLCVIVSIIGGVVLAWLVASERVGEMAIGYGCMVIQLLSAALGSVTAWRCIRHNKLAVSGLTVGGYYLLLLIMALSFGNGFSGMGVTALMVLLGGGIVQIPALFGNRSGAYRHKIKAFR